MRDIKKLLNKKGWTGKELGQIDIANMSHNFERSKEGKPYKPLVTRGEFRKMLNTLNDPVQGKAYNEYVNMHEWLSITYNIVSAQEQQAQGNFKTLIYKIATAKSIEETFRYIENLPVIVTEKQYNDYVAEKEAEIMEDHELNLFNMFEIALYSLLGDLRRSPEADNPLKDLKPQLEQELVTDPIILSRYNEVTGNVYYTIDETGERSDSMTPEEWRERLTPAGLEEELEKGCGDLTSKASIRMRETARATFNGATEEEIEAINKKYRLVPACTVHYYEDPPEDLNKWEILDAGELYNYYTSLESLDHNGEELTPDNYVEAVTADIEAFKKEFPTVFKAVTKDMERYIGKGAKKPVKEWANTVYSWADLKELNYYTFYDLYIKEALHNDSKRAMVNGVAVLKDSFINRSNIDERGYYKAPEVKDILGLSLRAFFPEHSEYASNANQMEDARETFLESFFYMQGFNKILDLLVDYYEVPQLEVFKFNTSIMADRVEAFNDLVAMFYKDIKEGEYGEYEDPEEKDKKLEVLKEFFYPLECEYSIPQKNIDKAVELFKSGEAFIDTNLTDLFCRREGA